MESGFASHEIFLHLTEISVFFFKTIHMKRKHLRVLLFVALFFMAGRSGAQTLELREICNLNYLTDYTSIADRNKDDLFPKGSTLGFVHFYRGISLLRQRSYHESIYDFKSALRDTTVSRSLCNLYLGIAFMQLGMPDSILTMYSRAMNVPVASLKNPDFWDNEPFNKDNSFASYLMGTNEAINTPQDTALIDALFGYTTKDNTFYDAFYNYGVYCYNIGRYSKAISLLEKAREIDDKDDSTVLLCLGYAYRITGDFEHAMKSYNLLLKGRDGLAPGFNNRGCLQAYLEKFPKAIGDLSKAIRKNNRLIEGYLNRGIIYLRMENWKSAIDDFTIAIQLQPALGDAYYFRGFARKASGDLNGSVGDFSRALELKKARQ
jgi:tetratricopeptide (TPR) repeat protein